MPWAMALDVADVNVAPFCPRQRLTLLRVERGRTQTRLDDQNQPSLEVSSAL